MARKLRGSVIGSKITQRGSNLNDDCLMPGTCAKLLTAILYYSFFRRGLSSDHLGIYKPLWLYEMQAPEKEINIAL
jgi:hypothetical protein